MDLQFKYENGHVVVYKNGVFFFSADNMTEAIKEAELALSA